MFKLHELPADPGKTQKRKRIGRGEGSGRGRTAGKGNKGSQARAGADKGAYFEGGQMPLIRRLPKYGFTNIKFRARRTQVTLEQLERHFEDGQTVDLEAMQQKRLFGRKIDQVKVLAGGTLTRKLHIKAYGFSAAARSAIEAVGGSCEIV